MTIKSFGFLNPSVEGNHEKNWRTLDTNTKFGNWTPETLNINNVGSTQGWYQLYGPIVFYWAKLTYNGVNMTPGVSPRILNLPYGPESPSGLKFFSESQVSINARGGAGGASFPLNASEDAWVSSVGGTAYIYLPSTWTATDIQFIWVQGWIFRDA
jgi:hypothetical protein